MDVTKILAELRGEREQIEEAILSLERLARGRTRGRGRLAELQRPLDVIELFGLGEGAGCAEDEEQ